MRVGLGSKLLPYSATAAVTGSSMNLRRRHRQRRKSFFNNEDTVSGG